MTDELTRAIAEATEGRQREGTAKWPECCRDTYSLAIEEIAAALAPLIEARVREARFSAVPGPLYNRVMDHLFTHPAYDALFAADELRKAIGASAQREAEREAKEVRRG